MILDLDTILAVAMAAVVPAKDGAKPDYSKAREEGLIECRYEGEGLVGWKLTPRGRVWFSAVMALELPEQRWMMPEETTTNFERRNSHDRSKEV